MYNTNYEQQIIRKKNTNNGVSCFFCGRNNLYNFDVITPEELYEYWGIINYDSVCLCELCQISYEEKQEQKEIETERQNDGYDYYWEANNP